MKDTPPTELVDAIHRVASGEPVLSPSVMRRLMDRGADQSRARQRAMSVVDALSDRELEVVAAIGAGQSNAEIADGLHMSVATVKSHVGHVFTKLGLTSRTQLAVLAHEADLL